MQTFQLQYETGMKGVDKSAHLVFGHLVRIAAPIVKSFHSDLYHDAMWLSEHMTGDSFTFIWSVDNCGTLIGTAHEAAHRENKFMLTVTCIDGRSELKITDLAGLDSRAITGLLRESRNS